MADGWFKSEFGGTAIVKKSSQNSTSKRKSEEKFINPVDPKKLKVAQQFNWLTEFQPETVADLAVHPKKIEDLRNWLKTCSLKSSNRILLISGPTGCAKSTTFKLLARENDFKVVEWINSIDNDFDLPQENSYGNFNIYRNQVDEFEKFLLKSSNYGSLFASKQKKILLVKDFPNVFLRKKDDFARIMLRFNEDGNCPLVFILTETSSRALDISFHLFTEQLRMELKTDSISFNAISATLMKRGIKRIFQMVESKDGGVKSQTAESVVESIIDNSAGDIRNAILNLSVASQDSEFKIVANEKKGSKAKKKSSKSEKSATAATSGNSFGKNEILSVMHGIGRVMYPKMEEDKVKNRLQLTHRPEDIAESFTSQPNVLIEMIHSNYMKNFTQIEHIASAANNLSISDTISSEYRDSTLSLVNLDFVIRSTMVHNESPASGFRPVSSYASKKFRNTKESNDEMLRRSMNKFNNGNLLVKKDFFCDYNSYAKIIEK